MKIELDRAQVNFGLNVALSTAGVMFGSYKLYTLLKKHPSDDSDGSYEDIGEAFLPSIIKSTPASMMGSMICASTWYLVTGGRIWDSSGGIAAFTAAYTFPPAMVTFCILDKWRLYDEAITIDKAFAATISTSCAVTLLASSNELTSNADVATIAITATFPVALTFFNYQTRNGLEQDDSVVAKAVSTSVAVAGAVSLFTAITSKLR